MATYDSFLAPANDRGSFSYTATSDGSVVYPDHDQVNIFGPLWLPRVYGKDLTAFEIASSGSIAVTLNDIHSFDLVRDNVNSNITLQTYSNDSFIIDVGQNSMYLSMDTDSNLVTMWGTSNMVIHADDDLKLEGNTITMVIGEDFDLNARNIGISAGSNVEITGVAGHILMSASNGSSTLGLAESNVSAYAALNVNVDAGSNLYLGADSNVYMTASNADMVLSAASETMKINMIADTHAMSITSSAGTVSVSAQDYVDVAANEVNVSALTGAITLTADNGDVSVGSGHTVEIVAKDFVASAGSNVYIGADSNVFITASNTSMFLSAASDTMKVNMDNNFVTIASTTGSIALAAQYDVNVDTNGLNVNANYVGITAATYNVDIESGANVEVSAAGSVLLTAAQGAAGVKLESSTSNILMYTPKDILVNAGNSIAIASSNEFTISSNSNMDIISGSNLTVTAASNMEMSSGSNFTLSATSNITMESATGSVNLEANGGKVFATFSAANNSLTVGSSNYIEITASNEFDVVAGSSINLEAVTSSLNLSANGGKVFAAFDATTNSLRIGASNEITVTASNNILITGADDTTIGGSNNVILKRDDNNLLAVQQDESILLKAGGVNIVTATHDKVTINGDVDVLGVLNSINILQSNLLIEDAKLTLAYDNVNGPLPDGPNTNDKAGLYVAGQYGGASNARSLTWNWNQGMQNLGQYDALDTESFWDVRGGALRMTHSNEAIECAFSFRITNTGELELVKKVGSAGFKRIAKFGKTVL